MNVTRCDVCGKEFDPRKDEWWRLEPRGPNPMVNVGDKGRAEFVTTRKAADVCSIGCISTWIENNGKVA